MPQRFDSPFPLANVLTTDNGQMDAASTTIRWSIRLAPNEYLIVRRAIAYNRKSFNECVV